MKEKIVSFLVCPFCKNDLKIKVISQIDHEIKEGDLFCSCGKVYPIINFVPRMVHSNQNTEEDKYYSDT